MTQNVRMKKTNEIYLSIFINLLNWKQSFEKVFWSKASEYTAGTLLTMETRNCTTEDFFFFFSKFLMIVLQSAFIIMQNQGKDYSCKTYFWILPLFGFRKHCSEKIFINYGIY